MKPLIFLLLASAAFGQVIFTEHFTADEIPPDWIKRFGRTVADPLDPANAVWNFANRTGTKDTITSAMDLSPAGNYDLTFRFRSEAISDHSLLIGLTADGTSIAYFAGSPVAAENRVLSDTFSGGENWTTVSLNITSWLTDYSALELSGIRLAFLDWNSGALSSGQIWLDDIVVSDPPSAIPEPGCGACLIAALAAVVAVVLRRKKIA